MNGEVIWQASDSLYPKSSMGKVIRDSVFEIFKCTRVLWALEKEIRYVLEKKRERERERERKRERFWSVEFEQRRAEQLGNRKMEILFEDGNDFLTPNVKQIFWTLFGIVFYLIVILPQSASCKGLLEIALNKTCRILSST